MCDARRMWIGLLVLAAGLGVATPVAAQSDAGEGASPEKTLSPYFLVRSGADRPEAFPLEATEVEIQVSGVIAEVAVRQTYRNAGESPIEAVYVFPASTRAAVHAMKMTVGDRVVEAVIKEREEARRTYEEAKTSGQSASLLEQQRPNVFQMNVANILPGDRIHVDLRYAELLVPEGGVYELVYPTVVGPRYSNRPAANAPAEHAWVENPYLRKGETDPTRFGLKVELDGGMPLADVASTSHPVRVDFAGPNRARVRLAPEAGEPANRDFILRYRLEDAKIQTGLLLDGKPGDDERFFLLMVQPPERVVPEMFPPREYVFVVDVSGSMNGFPIEVTKKLMRDLLAGLKPEDRFNLVLFSGGSTVMAPAPLPASRANLDAAMNVLDRQRGGGGTELLPALDVALAMPEGDAVRSIVIVTDGYVDVEAEAFERIRRHAGTTNVFAFGIGSSVNRHLIQGLAQAGRGEPFIVTSADEAAREGARFRTYISAPLLSDVTLDFGGLDAYDVEPATIPVLMAERPLIVTGKWRGQPKGEIRLRGRGGDGEWSTQVAVPAGAASNPGLRYLWARERLRDLSDFAGSSGANREAIVALGLEYSLLTAHTSFVAVDQVVRNTSGDPEPVRQPLPLPQNVSEMAVGTAAPGTPEPGTILLLGLAGGAAARALRRSRK